MCMHVNLNVCVHHELWSGEDAVACLLWEVTCVGYVLSNMFLVFTGCPGDFWFITLPMSLRCLSLFLMELQLGAQPPCTNWNFQWTNSVSHGTQITFCCTVAMTTSDSRYWYQPKQSLELHATECGDHFLCTINIFPYMNFFSHIPQTSCK
jgi:hypothetical protein